LDPDEVAVCVEVFEDVVVVDTVGEIGIVLE
jgi:hypothetical protein